MVGATSETEKIAGAEGLALISAWRKMEEDRKRPLGGAVDFYTIEPSNYLGETRPRELSRINSRPQFIRRLGDITHQFNPESIDGKFAAARERALNVYIDASEGRRSSRYRDLALYIEDTMDLPVGSPVGYTEISNDRITGLRNRVIELFVKAGGGNFDRDGWSRYAEVHTYDEARMREEYEAATEEFRPFFRQMAGLDHDPEVETKFESKPGVTWVNWTKMEVGSNILKINTHPDLRYRWFPGAIEHLVIHEVGGHLYEGEAWKQSILDGHSNPMYGATTIPGPEQWHAEGFANTLVFFNDDLYESLTPQGEFAAHLRLLQTWVQRNAHIRTNEEPHNLIKKLAAREYILDLLPHIPGHMVDRFLDQGVNDPYQRAYIAAYGGSYEHLIYAQRLREVEERSSWPFVMESSDLRSELVATFMTQPLEPMTINRAVENLVQPKKVA